MVTYTWAADSVGGDLTTWNAIQTRALASIPLERDGQLRASLFVNHRDPHRWTREEIGLIEDVAERPWDTLERSRAGEELGQLNASLEGEVEARTLERDRIRRVAPVLMVVADSRGVLLKANPAWTGVLGWSRGEPTRTRDASE